MARFRPRQGEDDSEIRIPIKPTLIHYGFEESEIRDDHGWHRVKCAFHGDDTPSASVNTEIHIFRCHVCDYRGNAAQLIMKKEGISNYGEAQRIAAGYAGAGHDAVHGGDRPRFRVSRKAGNHSGGGRYRRSWGGD